MIARLGVSAVLVLFSATASPAADCVALKLKAGSKLHQALVKCYAKSKGGFRDPSCYAKAKARFDESFAKAELVGACLGDAGGMKQAVIDSVVELVSGTTADSCLLALDGSASCVTNPSVPACGDVCVLVIADTFTSPPLYACECSVGP